MNENIRACLMQITFGLRCIKEVNRHSEEMCPMDENLQITEEFRELNANSNILHHTIRKYGITLKMLMQLKETKKLEEEE